MIVVSCNISYVKMIAFNQRAIITINDQMCSAFSSKHDPAGWGATDCLWGLALWVLKDCVYLSSKIEGMEQPNSQKMFSGIFNCLKMLFCLSSLTLALAFSSDFHNVIFLHLLSKVTFQGLHENEEWKG